MAVPWEEEPLCAQSRPSTIAHGGRKSHNSQNIPKSSQEGCWPGPNCHRDVLCSSDRPAALSLRPAEEGEVLPVVWLTEASASSPSHLEDFPDGEHGDRTVATHSSVFGLKSSHKTWLACSTSDTFRDFYRI